jgi:NAD(P)-dependent dehydrogenase (short-subunit alcohol dehydrogenase family)
VAAAARIFLGRREEAVTLAGKTVVVTGGGGAGMGYQLVKRLHDEGARVVTCDLRPEAVATLQAELPAVEAFAVDIGADVGTNQLLEQAGEVDVLCNHAAAGQGISPLLEQDDDGWRAAFSVIVDAAFRLSKAVLPGMIDRGGGVIINTASVAGLRGGRGGIAYTAAKFALIGMTMNIAATYGDRGIRCNAVCPGPMGPSGGSATTSQDSIQGLSEHGRQILTRDRGKPPRALSEEVAALAVFLAGDQARRINGACIPVDSGWIAY